MCRESITRELTEIQNSHTYRQRTVIEQRDGPMVIINQKSLLNFASFDYLGLNQHPEILRAFHDGIDQYGFGSSASAQISGYFSAHQQLEEAFAEFVQRDQAIFFNSGYQANLAVISALAKHQDLIYADKFVHASLIDGIQLSGAKLQRYRHNDLEHLSQLLMKQPAKLVISESVFSMEGDLVDLAKLQQLKDQHSFLLMIDDAHGIGILGEQGRGVSEYFNVNASVIDYLITPLGKAFAGFGAMVSGSREFMDYLLQFARSYRYTTAMPPAIASALLASLKIVQQDNWRRQKLLSLIEFTHAQCRLRNLPLLNESMTPIIPLLTYDNQKTLFLQQQLMRRGFFTACIRPPTVPKNLARLRISLSALHTEQHILALLDAIEAILHG